MACVVHPALLGNSKLYTLASVLFYFISIKVRNKTILLFWEMICHCKLNWVHVLCLLFSSLEFFHC